MSGLVTMGETLALASSVEPGHLAHADVLRVGVGGAESNVAIGVRRLGTDATWAGRVGDDSFGVRVVRELRAEGVSVHAVIDAGSPTALMVKERRTLDSGRVWYYRDGSAGSRLSPADLPVESVGGADVVHLTGITPGLSPTAMEAVRAMVDLAATSHVPISFDVNHRAGVWRERDARPVYRELARRSAVVFAGEDEARLLTGTSTTEPADLLEELASTSGGDAVLKLGADGCRALVDGVHLAVAAVPVRVVDSVGAGDAFVAGYLAELIAGHPPGRRLATAVRCGAFACLTAGDWEGLPTRADLDLLDGGDPVRR